MKMDVANCSLMEIAMASVGKYHLEEFSDQKKWTVLGLMNKPGSYLETDIGGKFRVYSDDELKEPFQTFISENFPCDMPQNFEMVK